MFVGEVYPPRLPGSRSPPMLSSGRPVSSTTSASNERQVSAAQVRSVRRSSPEVRAAPAADVLPAVLPAVLPVVLLVGCPSCSRSPGRR